MEYLACPKCSGSLRLKEPTLWSVPGDEIEQGQLDCAQCGTRHPIVCSVARELYAASFNFQWNKFPTLQLDKVMQNDLSRRRLYATTDWPEKMSGENIIDAGFGSGRFTEIALEPRG